MCTIINWYICISYVKHVRTSPGPAAVPTFAVYAHALRIILIQSVTLIEHMCKHKYKQCKCIQVHIYLYVIRTQTCVHICIHGYTYIFICMEHRHRYANAYIRQIGKITNTMINIYQFLLYVPLDEQISLFLPW